MLAIRNAAVFVRGQLGHDLIVRGGFGCSAGLILVAGRHGRLEPGLLGLLGALIGVDAALRTSVLSALGTQGWPSDALRGSGTLRIGGRHGEKSHPRNDQPEGTLTST